MESRERRRLARIVAARQRTNEEVLGIEQNLSDAPSTLDPAESLATTRADEVQSPDAKTAAAREQRPQKEVRLLPDQDKINDAADWRTRSLRQLYETHDGKVSDKWSLYLTEYDRLFAPYRDQPIRILEIGIQNGGSLELWSKYFWKAEKIVGCDINQDCKRLQYDDPRISVMVGDANVEETRKQILRNCDSFDIIIDDASHQSKDVICSFARYFSCLNVGGLYAIEDLHCSYWKEWGGGLYHPGSSIAFLKLLVDVINREHWGIDRASSELLRGFEECYGAPFVEGLLRKINSLEFANSLCFIKKQEDETNLLGPRVVTGTSEVIAPNRAFHGTKLAQPDQRDSKWSRQVIDDEALLRAELGRARAELVQLHDAARQHQDLKSKLSAVESSLDAITTSTVWRLTQPVRQLGSHLPRPARFWLRRVLKSFYWALMTLFISASFETIYSRWVGVQEALDSAEKPERVLHLSTMNYRPKINVVIDMVASRNASDAALRDTLSSIKDQLYACSRVIIKAPRTIDSDISRVAKLPTTVEAGLPVDTLNADFLVFVLCGDILHPSALYKFAASLNAEPNIDLLYADEDRIGPGGERSAPFVKPGWSPDYLETFNYIGYPACIRATLLAGLLDLTYYEVVLRVTERTGRIKHLQEFLCHCKSNPQKRGAAEHDIAALEGRLARTGRSGVVTESVVAAGCYTISPRLRRAPRISIIIPSTGRPKIVDGRKVDFLGNLIEQISGSSYPNFEIIVASYPAMAPARVGWLEKWGCRVVSYEAALFSFARSINLGASVATGDLLLLLNDDMALTAPDWLDRLAWQFEKPHVGVVGARLLYPDGKIQHAGVVQISGNPAHVRYCYPRDDIGYFFSTCGVRNFLAVTGACLMTRRSVFEDIGGLSEQFPLSYNDTDYCMKVGALGWSVLYTGDVKLVHFESQTRNPAVLPLELSMYQNKWAGMVFDPYYNESFLDAKRASFELAINKRRI